MLFDKLLDWLFSLLEWLMGLLPDMPAEATLSAEVLRGVAFIDQWIDIEAVAQAALGVLGCLGLLLTWAAINWGINKVRGSG